jgi:hypothetical protein
MILMGWVRPDRIDYEWGLPRTIKSSCSGSDTQ